MCRFQRINHLLGIRWIPFQAAIIDVLASHIVDYFTCQFVDRGSSVNVLLSALLARWVNVWIGEGSTISSGLYHYPMWQQPLPTPNCVESVRDRLQHHDPILYISYPLKICGAIIYNTILTYTTTPTRIQSGGNRLEHHGDIIQKIRIWSKNLLLENTDTGPNMALRGACAIHVHRL